MCPHSTRGLAIRPAGLHFLQRSFGRRFQQLLAHSSLDRRCRTRRCPPPEFLRPPEPHRQRYQAPLHHLLRCGSSEPRSLRISANLRILCSVDGNKLLCSETWIHRHHQHVVDDVEHFRERLDRGRRIDHHARQAIVALDQVQRPVQMAASFLMHRDPVRPASANTGIYSSGFSIIRWQSSGSSVALRSDFTTGGPIVRLGTKCPSMMSTWMTCRPPRLPRAPARPAGRSPPKESTVPVRSNVNSQSLVSEKQHSCSE